MHVERVRELAPMVAELRGGFDAAGRLPDQLVDELRARKLFRLWLPVSLGGLGLSAFEFMDVVEEAASLDGTIGWLVGNGGGMSRAGAFLDQRSAHRIFDDPDAFVVSSTAARGRAERTEAGFVVSGRWAFGSGSPHATWFAPMCGVYVDGAPTGQVVLVYVPRHQVVLHDNWEVSGLRATGSVDFELRDVVDPSFVDTFQPRLSTRQRCTGCRPLRSSRGRLRRSRSASHEGRSLRSLLWPRRASVVARPCSWHSASWSSPGWGRSWPGSARAELTFERP